MMRRLALLAVALTIAAGVARAEELTIAVSTPEVEISSNFTGTTITVFGVIERSFGAPPPSGDYQVAIVLLGPAETVVARRKDRVLGIWANRASETIIAVPSYYALSSSAVPQDLAPPPILERLDLGFDNIDFAYKARASINDPGAAEFRNAFIRLKERASLYDEQVGVGFIGDNIFRSFIHLPANVPVGRYTVLAYLFADGALIARTEERLLVSKTGFERLLSGFAANQSLVYGLVCVALAIFVGWLGGVIFRRD